MTTATIDNRLVPAGIGDLAAEVREGLSRPLKELPPKLFYDSRGSELFDLITEQPEYYPTRCEREILEARADAIVAGLEELVELGSGAADKARVLIGTGAIRRYVPVDVSESAVEGCARELRAEFPGLAVHGLIGDFDRDLVHLPGGDRRLFAFLGGTIGNFRPAPRRSFLARIATLMYPGDRFLLGTDLVKDHARLEAAYDDAAGVTAEFNKNVLHVLNREFDADFDPDRFEHVAFFDPDNSWIDIRLRSLTEQFIDLRELDMRVHFARNEEMRTEISTKFTPERLEEIYADAGLEMTDLWTDPEGLYALSLARARH